MHFELEKNASAMFTFSVFGKLPNDEKFRAKMKRLPNGAEKANTSHLGVEGKRTKTQAWIGIDVVLVEGHPSAR